MHLVSIAYNIKIRLCTSFHSTEADFLIAANDVLRNGLIEYLRQG